MKTLLIKLAVYYLAYMHVAYIKNSNGVDRSSDTSKNGFLAITLQTYESQVGNNTTKLCNIF
jgi:hypothetical protein